MAIAPNFPRFDGLMDLAKREGVDIRPTLLRVLTDLYVQTPLHTDSEERQFVELATRLIDEVDDATRAAVRARLSIYPHAPSRLLRQLDSFRAPKAPAAPAALSPEPQTPLVLEPGSSEPAWPEPPVDPRAAMLADLRALNDMFFAANSAQRLQILRKFESVPLAGVPRIDSIRARHVVPALERAALDNDRARFAFELTEVLVLPRVMINRIVDDEGGEPLLFVARLIELSSTTLQRIIMFLPPAEVATTEHIFRLARLYESITPQIATAALAMWRASAGHVARPRHVPQLYDDETGRTRSPQASPAPGRAASFARRTRETG